MAGKKVRDLAERWCAGRMPEWEEFRGLTPDQGEQVAVLAGYNTNHEMHAAMHGGIREICRRLQAGESLPD